MEREACDALGLTLHSVALASRKAPEKDELQRMIAIMGDLERPALIHCKSGADRAGLAATLYLHVIEGQPLEKARAQLSWRNLHFRFTKTGVLDLFLDQYHARNAETGIGFDQWLAEDYDAEALQSAFKASRS